MNTVDFLNIATSICPDKTAIIFEGKKFTFSQLNERVNRLANGLLKLELKGRQGCTSANKLQSVYRDLLCRG